MLQVKHLDRLIPLGLPAAGHIGNVLQISQLI
jgi:hypothetical protein